MTICIREQILQAIVTKLGNLTGVTIERNRDAAVQAFPSLIVRDGNQETASINSGMTDYTMTVSIEGFVKSSSTASIGTDLNDLYARIVKAIIADYTLGGIAEDIAETGMDMLIDDMPGNAPHGAFNVTFQVKYTTLENDPYSLAP